MEELIAVIKGNISDFQAKMNQVSSKLENVSKKFKDIGETASKFVTLPVLAAGAASFKMASDYQESINKVDVAFKDSADEVKKWSETTLKAFGIASGTALDMAALYGDMATSMGFNSQQAAKMSMELVGLAGDMASFKNISIDVANIALKSIFTGETESLKTLGIVMTEANIKAYMLSQGIKTNYDTMDQAQKVAIRYQYVMAQTANSQGDFARTGGGAANQMRIMWESLKELAVTFGNVLLPAITKIIKKINEWLESLRNTSPELKKMIIVIAALAAAVGPLLVALGFLTSTIIPALVAGGAAVSVAWLPITAIIVGITGAILLLNSAAKETNNAVKAIDEEQKQVNKLVMQLTDANTKEGDRKKILDDLNRINPKIVENINAEKISVSQLTDNLRAYNEEISNRIILANIQAEEEKELARLADVRTKIAEAQIKVLDIILASNEGIALSEDTFNGKLEKTLKYLSDEVEKQKQLKQLGDVRVTRAGTLVDYRTKEQRQLQELIDLNSYLITQGGILNKTESKTEGYQKKVQALKDILGLSEKVSKTLTPDGGEGGDDTVLGLIPKLKKQIEELEKKKNSLISENSIKETQKQIDVLKSQLDDLTNWRGGELKEIKPKELGKNTLTKDLKVTAEALKDVNKEYITYIENSETYGGVVERTFRQATSSIRGVIGELQEFEINMNAIFEDLAESTITAFATEIGNVLGGGDFGLDRILTMFADWAIKLGSILIAAGVSITAFKTQILANPLGVVALGAALVAAGAAVKAAVQTNPTSSSGSGSSSGGGRDNWDAFGERNLRGKIEVQVNGVLKGSGRDLYGVITKENTRKSL